MASIKGIIVEIGGDTSGLQKALSKVNSSTSSLSKELKGVNSLLKLDPKNTELVSQKQEVLKENIEQTASKLEQLKKTQELADDAIRSGAEISEENQRNLQREIINTENKLKQLKLEASNWTTAGRSIEEFGNKVKNISDKVDKMGTTLTTRLTLPIAGIAVGLVNASKEFETAFTGVEKTVDGTAEQMATLKQGIKDLSEELPSSTTEISAVAEAAGQLGIQTDNILSFSKAMLDLGNSTNLTADEAASQLAKFANITEMSQKDFYKLGSSIVDLGNNFATTEADIVNMAMRLAGAGHQVGMSEGEILGLATALSSVGIEAEMGGSAISKAMVKMQNAVEMGGTKLNTVLQKTGMSLRDLELMSANDSKGFKEMSQSIGMTSTEVKQLITAGTNLEDFASVSNMTVKQFQKAWKEDASGALSAFIQGLGKAEDKGESAITMLSEMGLTEVRLRDSLLRAANAGDLFNNAIETGTKAWDENVALTNEANKRYQTLDSRLQTTKNKLLNVATSTGDKLTPTFNKLLDNIDKLIDKFDGLNEEEVKNVLKTAGIVAAIGPAIKIIGTLGKGIGNTAKGIGTFSQAIAVMNTGAKSSNISVNNLAKVIEAIKSPAGLATIAITALTAAVVAYAVKTHNEMSSLNGVADSLKNQKEKWKELEETREEFLNKSSTEITTTERLSNELKTIVDENGKIKESYKDRANYIVNELNNALGTEYSINGDIIEQYKTMQENIQKLIEKKKAEALLSAYQEEYAEALKSQGEATENLISLQQQMADAQEKLHKTSGTEHFETQKQIERISKAIQEQVGIIDNCGFTIQNYENLQTATVSNSAEAIEEAVDRMGTSWDRAKEQSQQSIEQQVNSQAIYVQQLKSALQQAKDSNDEYQQYILNGQLETAEKQLETLATSMAEQTSTIEKLSENEINAWTTLANSNYTAYKGALSKLPIETQEEIEKATGVMTYNTSLSNASGDLADNATMYFNTNLAMEKGAESALKNAANKMYFDTSVSNAARDLAGDANTGFNNHIDGGKWGNDLSKNISSGMTSSSSRFSISNAAKTIGSWISEFLHHSTPDKGPLKDDDVWMSDMISNFVKDIDRNKTKVTKSAEGLARELNLPFENNIRDFGNLQGALSTQIVDSTKTIFTTPQIVFNVQELDEAKLQQCFNYINKKFGSKY